MISSSLQVFNAVLKAYESEEGQGHSARRAAQVGPSLNVSCRAQLALCPEKPLRGYHGVWIEKVAELAV